MLSVETTNTNFIIFGLTRSGFRPMFYHTRGEHANKKYHTVATIPKTNIKIVYRKRNNRYP